MDHQAFAEMLGNYGEFLGSVAVLATLIYLAVQIRHSQKFAMAQAYQARADQAIQIAHFQNPEVLAKLASEEPDRLIDWSKIEDLSPEEQGDVGRWLNLAMVQGDNTLYQIELGLMPAEHVKLGGQAHMSLKMLYPGWERLRIPITERMRRLLDQLGVR